MFKTCTMRQALICQYHSFWSVELAYDWHICTAKASSYYTSMISNQLLHF
jgi:hypothetical protein